MQYFEKRAFLKNVVILGGGTFLAQLVVFSLTPIITRLYGVEDFGVLQTYIYIVSFFTVSACLKLELAILIEESLQRLKDLIIISFYSIFFIFILLSCLAVLIFFFGSEISYFSEIKDQIWFVPFMFLASSVYLLFNYISLRKKAFKSISASKLSQGVGNTTTQISCGIINLSKVGLLLGEIFAKFFGAIILFPTFRDTFFRNSSGHSDSLKSTLIRYKKFPLITMPGALVNMGGLAVPILMFGGHYGTAALGFFSLVNRVFALPSSLIGQSIAQVYASDLPNLAKTDPKKLREVFLDILKKLSLISFFPLLLGGYFAPQLFSFVFGDLWLESGFYFQLLIPLFFFGFIISPLTHTLNLLEKQGYQLGWEISRFLGTVSVMLIIIYSGGTSREAILGYSFVMSFFYLLHFGLSFYFVNQIVKLQNTIE